MRTRRSTDLLPRLIGLLVLSYGTGTIALSFIRQLRLHGRHDIDTSFTALPLVIGLSYVYLGSLLVRRKYNAWLTACVLSLLSIGVGVLQLHHSAGGDEPNVLQVMRIVVPVVLFGLLLLSRASFRVKSDMLGFRHALQISSIMLLVALLYGTGGFMLLDKRDFHHEIGLGTAVHQTIDQFGLTTNSLQPHTRRSRLFLDSLSVVSIGALVYTAASFFQPLRQRLASEDLHREQAERLLRQYPSDIDDFFKLWPHDKHYYFDASSQAGLAYHVTRGVALVVGNPFGDPKKFRYLVTSFLELCFVNDWLPAFIHVSDSHRTLYEKAGFRLQKIGEEAVLDLASWPEVQTGKSGKYFREIRNRFTRLGYSVEILTPPYDSALLIRLREISNEWLTKPGRSERGFMLGYHSNAYFQQGPLAVVYDDTQQIQGFVNLVPTFASGTANYDLLRCSDQTPGNCNDFLLMGTLDHLHATGYHSFNLGLSPLAGLNELANSDDKTLVDNALRFFYSNGNRLYSFSGLHRFKSKYHPVWHDRYIAYPGGMRNFTRVVTALNRAMKVK